LTPGTPEIVRCQNGEGVTAVNRTFPQTLDFSMPKTPLVDIWNQRFAAMRQGFGTLGPTYRPADRSLSLQQPQARTLAIEELDSGLFEDRDDLGKRFGS
jgi:hypothetical protein